MNKNLSPLRALLAFAGLTNPAALPAQIASTIGRKGSRIRAGGYGRDLQKHFDAKRANARIAEKALAYANKR